MVYNQQVTKIICNKGVGFIVRRTIVMTSQIFALKLNTLLDRFNFPQACEDRESTCSEYFNLSRRMTSMILRGILLPRVSVIEKIANELLIDVEELVG